MSCPDSPYLLPAGHVQVAFSGGRTSAYMLYQILEANGGLPDGRPARNPDEVDTVAELEAFDVVVIGNAGGN